MPTNYDEDKGSMPTIYELEDYDIFKNKASGAQYSVKGFAFRYPDKAQCVLIEDTHFETQWVITLTDLQELFEKVPDEEEK